MKKLNRAKVRMCIDRLPPEGKLELFAALAREEDPTNVALGMGQAVGRGLLMPARIAVITAKKWANGRTLGVAFVGGTAKKRKFVADTVTARCHHINLTTRWGVSAGESDLRIGFDPNGGAWSYIGTDNKGIGKSEQTMNLGWLDEAVVLHEFHHAFGCIHEHQHPQSDIPWNKEAVYRYFSGPPNYWDRETIEHNLFESYSIGQSQFSSYDQSSIMHYAIDASLLTDPSRAVGWNTSLSPSDVRFMSELYPKTPPPPPPPPPPTPGHIAYLIGYDKDDKQIAKFKP